jgi:hypothetical protein
VDVGRQRVVSCDAGSVWRRSSAKGQKEKLGCYWANLGRLMLAEQTTVWLRVGKIKEGEG